MCVATPLPIRSALCQQPQRATNDRTVGPHILLTPFTWRPDVGRILWSCGCHMSPTLCRWFRRALPSPTGSNSTPIETRRAERKKRLWVCPSSCVALRCLASSSLSAHKHDASEPALQSIDARHKPQRRTTPTKQMQVFPREPEVWGTPRAPGPVCHNATPINAKSVERRGLGS